MLDKVNRILIYLLERFPENFSPDTLERSLFFGGLRNAVPLNPAPDWADELDAGLLIDWCDLLFEDLDRFEQLFDYPQEHSFQAHFAALNAEELAALLTPGSEFLMATRALAEVLGAANRVGLMLSRIDPKLFVIHEGRIDPDWKTLESRFSLKGETRLNNYDIGWMHQALRKREIPPGMTPSAATTHTFAYLILYTLTRLPPAANQASLLNQIERFRVYNPRLPPELRAWLRHWLRLPANTEQTPLDCWKGLHDLVCSAASRSENTQVQHEVGGDSVFGRNKRGCQNEDCLYILDTVPGITLLGVADGVSTAAIGTGGQASFTVREIAYRQNSTLVSQLQALVESDDWEAAGWKLIEAFFENCHRAVVDKINACLTDETPAALEDTMSSTLVLALVRGNQALIGHWGDSRAYRLSATSAVRLTEDHNREMEVLLASKGTTYQQPEQGAPLTRVVGQCRAVSEGGTCEPVAQKVSRDHCLLAPDEWLLLCSDGLLGGLLGANDAEKEARVIEIATRHGAAGCRELARQLVRTADDDKGDDNITAVLLRVHDRESTKQPEGNSHHG